MEWKKTQHEEERKPKKNSELRGNTTQEPVGICEKKNSMRVEPMTHPPELNEIRTALMFSGRLCVDTSRSTAAENAFNFKFHRRACIDQSTVDISTANSNWIIQLSMISIIIYDDDFIFMCTEPLQMWIFLR